MSALGERLIASRRGATRIADLTGLVPADYAAAMAVQAEVARALGATVGGWKVAVRPEGVAVAAPIFAADMRASGGSWTFGGLTLGIELEVALMLKRDLRPGKITRADILDAATLLVGIEIVESRIADATPPYPAALADNMANGGYVTGPTVSVNRKLDLEALTAKVTIDGRAVIDGSVRHAAGDPLAWVVAWASRPIDQLGGLRKGQIITTGALCGLIPVSGPARVEASLSGFGDIAVAFT